ncbi:hypothetical protein A4D02_00210 [Niastella koreensis]|uniref:Uncharacterized protein n=2 Tax=Niastella koreensis TaxID=354356 RepID=G8TA38_NIAKG|nr:hypothetical protein [Niastella koreensis]AEW02410.1 hypothetical protein Niako_6185 [Niastella koreensis GR20-10]OQP54787.1 hypothetical protein A4D02_00210 [Niastella koreensis]
MGLFSFFNNKNGHSNGLNGSTLPIGHDYPEVPEKLFIEKEAPKENKPEGTPITATSENNIDLLFKFLDRNHESSGYDDALINPDTSHMEQRIQAIKNEFERTIRKVKTYYEDFIKEIEFHIISRSRNGMIDTVEELTMKKEIAESHIRKVLEIDEDAKNNRGDSQGIVMSYTRGFKNGLAAISHHSILKRKL